MKKILVFILLFIVIIFTACNNQNSPIEESSNEELRFAYYSFPENLILGDYQEERATDLLCFLFEGLVEKNKENVIVPALAEKYEISKDRLTYKFKLRDNIYWSNGEEITSNDFVEFFKSLLNLPSNNLEGEKLFCIFGAEEYSKGKKDFSGVAINNIDRKNFTIRLNYVKDSFLEDLSKPFFRLRKDMNYLMTWKSNYKNLSYTGPYVIDSIDSKNDNIILKKNNNYWDKNQVVSDVVDIRVYSKEVALSKYDIKELDFLLDFPLNLMSKNIHEENYKGINNGNVFGISFNLSKDNVFYKESNRALLLNSLDKKIIQQEISLLDSFSWTLDEEKKRNINNPLKEEEKTITTSGKEITKEEQELLGNKKVLRIIAEKEDKLKIISEGIAKSIKASLGITGQVRLYSEEEIQEVILKGEFDILVRSYDFQNKNSFLKEWITSKSNYKYSNKNYDAQYQKYIKERDGIKNKELEISLYNIITNDKVFIPILYDRILIIKQDYIRSIDLDGNKNLNLKNIIKLSMPKEKGIEENYKDGKDYKDIEFIPRG